ncbi:MAG TPA: hypothetical protein PK006_03200 [Saprospiraceae bacterium]|nr:hypothetical protein [Saprospiraceae bacterium]
MNKNYKSLESIFRSKLHQHNEKVDLENLLVHLNLKEEKKSNRVFWFWGLGIAFSFLMAFVSFSQFDLLDGQTALSHNNSSVNNEMRINSEVNGNNSLTNTKERLEKENEATNEDLKVQSLFTKRVDLNAGNLISENNRKPFTQIDKTNFGQHSIIKMDNPEIASMEAKSVSSIIESEESSGPVYSPALFDNNLIHPTEAHFGRLLEKTEFLNKRYDRFELLPKRPRVRGIDCYSFIGNSSKFALEIIPTYVLPWKKLVYTGTEVDTFFDQFKNNEHTLEGFSIAVNAIYFSKQNWYAKTGVKFCSISEQYKDFTKNTRIDTTFGIKAIYLDPNGDSTIVYGKIPITVTSLKERVLYSYLRLLDVQLGLGYQYPLGKWSIMADVMANFNLLYKINGRSVNTNAQIVDFDNPSNTNQGTSLGVNAVASLKLAYQFRPNWQMAFGPEVYLHRKIFSPSQSIYQRSYQITGLSLACIKTF